MATEKKKNSQAWPVLPLRGQVVFPTMMASLEVGREKSLRALEEALRQERRMVLVMQKDTRADEPAAADIYGVGTLAEIQSVKEMPGGTMKVVFASISRVRVIRFTRDEPSFRALVQEIPEEELSSSEAEALVRTLHSQFELYAKRSKKVSAEAVAGILSLNEPGRLADTITSQIPLRSDDRQAVLSNFPIIARMEQVSDILARETELLELEGKINARVRRQMEKTQKEYYLREQIKAIQKELGERDEKGTEAEEYRRKLDALDLSPETKDKFTREVERLEKMPPMAAEAVVVRNYLDWVTNLPWNNFTTDRLDLAEAEQILGEDHYGLEKVKERILEYLAIRKLKDKMKGPILCLVGPPGVGKTSLARSVARAIDRKFVRVSLGGVRDEAEIRGHRRTYVGALPGRLIQGMRTAGSANPVFLLDEVDKMSADFRGDPASALLEVLDPEQNKAFSDHYVEAPFDMSNVMFITTANLVWNIPRPLLDRMEVIYLSGYTEDEKLEIAKRHLLPKQKLEHGLAADQVDVSDNALRTVIREYSREAGVRNLERRVAELCRKAARKIVQGEETTAKVTAQNLHLYLGAPKYRWGQAEKHDEVGVATGLVVTEAGGDTVPVEVSVMKGKGDLLLTGRLGEVMRESAQAGFSYIRSRVRDLQVDEEFHTKFDIHVHVPEGAVPKDGPSAGITMVTAVVSALTRRPVRRDVAMTGEVTLRGRVLPVGGVKEKTLAAHRAGVTTIILPKENERDVDDVPANIRRKVNIIFVENMDEVLRVALGEDLVSEEGLSFPPENIPIPPAEATQIHPTGPVA